MVFRWALIRGLPRAGVEPQPGSHLCNGRTIEQAAINYSYFSNRQTFLASFHLVLKLNMSKTRLVWSTSFLVLAWCQEHQDTKTVLKIQIGGVESLFLGFLKEDIFYFFFKNNFALKVLLSLYSYYICYSTGSGTLTFRRGLVTIRPSPVTIWPSPVTIRPSPIPIRRSLVTIRPSPGY